MHPAHRQSTIEPFPLPAQSDFTVLIVDDEYINRFLLQNIVEGIGYTTRKAENGAAALELVAETPPDLILLDIMMPDINGYELCRRLKGNPATANIPVIFVTALTDTANLIKGFAVGAEDYIGKPINEGEVRARVQTHLKLKAAVDQIRKYNEELEQVVAESSRELVRSERQAAFGQLIQGIVHNLKGPLTSIRGSAQACQITVKTLVGELDAMAQRAPDAVPARLTDLSRAATKAAELVDTASRRLTEMINALMYKSSSDQRDKEEQLDLNAIVGEELAFLQADLHFKHHVRKAITLAQEPLPILAVAPEIAQVITNLVSNALDATHAAAEPTITITTARRCGAAWLTVADNGSGIASEHLGRIFDPFFTTKPRRQMGATPENGPIGTGLGLYMCMRSVKALGGDIQVDSAVGKGTTFRVKIPLALQPATEEGCDGDNSPVLHQ